MNVIPNKYQLLEEYLLEFPIDPHQFSKQKGIKLEVLKNLKYRWKKENLENYTDWQIRMEQKVKEVQKEYQDLAQIVINGVKKGTYQEMNDTKEFTLLRYYQIFQIKPDQIIPFSLFCEWFPFLITQENKKYVTIFLEKERSCFLHKITLDQVQREVDYHDEILISPELKEEVFSYLTEKNFPHVRSLYQMVLRDKMQEIQKNQFFILQKNCQNKKTML